MEVKLNSEVVLLDGIIKTPYIVSVNKLYEPIISNRTFGNTKVGVFCGLKLSEDAVKLKSSINTELLKSKLEIDKSKLDWSKPFIFSLVYILSESYRSRDCGNMEKCVTDSIFSYFGLNDNRIVGLHQYKIFNAYNGSEYIKFKLTQPHLKFNEIKI